MATDPAERLASHRMIPVFLAEEITNLMDAVERNLRRMLGNEELPADLLRGLLLTQRLLVIVDALSEREDTTQRHVESIFAEDMPLNAVMITSRRDPDLGGVDRVTLYPELLTGDRLVPFIFEYLRRRNQDTLFPGRLQVQLGDRVLALAEAGGRTTPVTPLLAKLFVDGAIERARQGLHLDDMPDQVPEVFVDYLRRLNPTTGPAADLVPQEQLIRAARVLAKVSLGTNLVPSDFRREDGTSALAELGNIGEPKRLLERLITNGVLESKEFMSVALLRFGLDPAAEYLAAIEWIDKLRTATDGWKSFLEQVKATEGYPIE